MRKLIFVICCTISVCVAAGQIDRSHDSYFREYRYNYAIIESAGADVYTLSPFSPASKPHTDYLAKSKKQKKTAVILLASGGALIATAAIIPRGNYVKRDWITEAILGQEHKNDGIKTAVFLVGAGSALASIPFFVISKKNQRRAARLSFIFKVEDAYTASLSSLRNYPATGLRVNMAK